ncbi:MAG: transporter [Solirubrobacterales bacterium]|nr:transporter [Solirubrobacterales bacterium]
MVLWIILIIAAGILAGIGAERRWPERAGHASRQSLLVILYVVLPPIVFVNMTHAEFGAGMGIGLGVGLLSVVLLGTIGWVIAVPLLKLPRPVAGAVITCGIASNTGYLGYPMVLTLMGGRDLTQGVVYDVVVSGITLMVFAFAVGAAFGTKAGEGVGDRVRAFFVKNPILYAGILGVFAPEALAPKLAVDISWILVMAILPVGFFAVGAVLAEEERVGAIRLPPRVHRPVGAVIFMRLVLSPAFLILLTLPFSGIPRSFYLMAVMPTGLNSMIVGHAYGLDLRTIAESLIYTTLIVVVGAGIWSLIA